METNILQLSMAIAIFIISLVITWLLIKEFRSKRNINNDHFDSNFSGLIKQEDAFNIIRNYKPRRDLHKKLLPEESKDNGDAHSTFLTLHDLKSYIDYIENVGKTKNIVVNGLRIYFGAYPNDDKYGDKKGLQTLVIYPTSKNTRNSIDFDAIDLVSSTNNTPNFIHNKIALDGLRLKSVGNEQLDIEPGVEYSSAFNDMNSSPPRQPIGGL